VIKNVSDFRALDPFFRIIEQGLAGLADGDHFFDLLAEDVVIDFIITVPDYPRHVVGRANLIELYRGYGATFSSTAATTSVSTIRRRHRRSYSNTPPKERWCPPDGHTATATSRWSPSRTAK
jgi:hypothetical protein